MQKQLFALTTIATFAALTSATAVTGCSDAGIATSSDGGASDSSTRDARKPPATDDEPDEPDEVLCYKADPIDVSSIGYKPARHRPGSCTGWIETRRSPSAACSVRTRSSRTETGAPSSS